MEKYSTSTFNEERKKGGGGKRKQEEIEERCLLQRERERERESARKSFNNVVARRADAEERDGRNCEGRSVPLIRREIARTICPISLSFGRLQFLMSF